MTSKELQDILKQYPDETQIYTHYPVQGDCENCKETKKEDIYYDDRYPAIVLMS